MLNRRFSFSTYLVINIIVSILSACSSPKSSGDDVPRNPDFAVALMTPGPISDQSWNAGAYQGLLHIRDSLGAQISHIQTKTPAEFEENFRQYGAKGYALVFGHGFEFQDAAARVAPDYPKTIFVTTGGTRTSRNVSAMSFAFEEPSYLAGIVAAGVSRSGVVGVIGGTELPPVKAGFAAFVQGVHDVNPRAKVISAYIGNWEDAGAGKEQALAQIARGADVIYQNADAAGLGVFQAARESTGIYVIGSNANQNAVAPNVTLGSVVIDLPNAFMVMAREVHSGEFSPRVHYLDTKSGVMKWIPNPRLTALTPQRTLQLVDSLERQMRAGTFTRLSSSAVK